MEVALLGQPFSHDRCLGALLVDALADASAMWAVSAWAQTSGLRRLAAPIRALRDRGGATSIVVGVDGGIATREGLQLAAELFEDAWVFHDTGTRTFHPKLFCVERPAEIVVSIGSSNLTRGGLFENYEANVLLRLSPRSARDRELLTQLRGYRDAFAADGMPCRRLTPELLAELCEDDTLVASERRRQQAMRTRRAKAEAAARRVFGAPVKGLPEAPEVARESDRSRVGSPPPAAGPRARPVLCWWKPLTPSDALRKPPTSHQRNYVTLTRDRHDIDRNTWFRDELFKGVEWSEQRMHTGRRKLLARVPFEVFVGERYLGRHELIVDHAEGRIARQNNAPTYLNWSGLASTIREEDYRGWWLELARLPRGRFRLRLLPDEPEQRF